jgi:hypothetical protein
MTGGIVEAEGLGDGPAHGKDVIAKPQSTMPPTRSDDFALALVLTGLKLAADGRFGYTYRHWLWVDKQPL